MLGPGSIYSAIQWYWLVGALLPVLFYLAVRMFPRSPARLLNAPVMLGAMGWLPPYVSLFLSKPTLTNALIRATPVSFFSWAIIGLIFNYWIRRRWFGWWHSYNYVTAAALDSGLIISTIVVFFTITFTKAKVPVWWGNNVVTNTLVSLYLPSR
jgi:hypothetical protein